MRSHDAIHAAYVAYSFVTGKNMTDQGICLNRAVIQVACKWPTQMAAVSSFA